ncbi:hypothetical protein PR202_gb17292 [Eleusine coracana subsp. coracana]|uniref:Uncharacterized protein n=1 Tax=Eleusine coracana subsp. coracana TaxID=191504 RepID=A0AAV5F091_ELECO|nr:hypothetical protein PR202_gb17292 [Eleusine coracana subsp. coracana]
MGRQPCCDKVGVKKGPWTAEEDQKLVGFLLTHGHCCWRVVPKLADNEIKNHWNTHIRKKLLRMGIDPVTHQPLQKAPAAPPVQQEQEKHEQKAESPQLQDQQQQQEAAVEEEEQDPPVIQPQEIPAPPPPATSTCGSASSAGSASVVSPSYSSSASASAASGVEATEWPEPMYLFGMDGIMDAGWGGLFPGDGGLSLDPFDQYPGAGFDQGGDDWM